MGLFLSTYVNKVDKKGRVSVPAPFRAVLNSAAGGAGGAAGAQGELIVFRSLQATALDACGVDYMTQLSDALDNPDMPDDLRDLIETTVFGGSVRLPIDPEGRITLPEGLTGFAGIGEEIAFVGRRRTFQLWEPQAFAAHEAASRDQGRTANISLSTILARTAAATRGVPS